MIRKPLDLILGVLLFLSVGAVAEPPNSQRIFVTSESWRGDLGGISGADQKCQASADNAGLGGVWRAVISDSRTSARSRLHVNHPVKLLNGNLVASDESQFWGGSVNQAVNRTETGDAPNHLVWTGTRTNGDKDANSANRLCDNWNSTNGGVDVGRTDRTNSEWINLYGTEQGGGNSCSNQGALYCLEQTLVPPAPTSQTCGDQNLDAGEGCDDGNTTNNDGCSATCAIEVSCGNNTIEDGEQCDDGNNANGDGCSQFCAFEAPAGCGNGRIGAGEECDDGNTSSGDGCSEFCLTERRTSTRCGDGNLDPGEACDDGNNTNGPSCTATCAITADCGNGTLDPGEICDDGNRADGDGCGQYCIPELVLDSCGNGRVDSNEQCDDGNNVDSDSCNNSCQRNETVDVEGSVLVDPDTSKLADLVDSDTPPQNISDFLSANFDGIDTSGDTIKIRTTRMNNFLILRYYVKDVFPNPPANPGRIKMRFDLGGSVNNSGCTGESNSLCVFAYQYKDNAPVFLSSIPNSWVENVRVPRNHDLDEPFAILILRNEDNVRKNVSPSAVALETENSVGTRVDVEPPSAIQIDPLPEPICRISVSGAKGPVNNRSCPGNNPCTTNNVTLVNNGALNFSVVLEGIPGSMATPKSVEWTPADHPNGASGLNSSGTWLFPPVTPDPPADVQARVETKSGKTVHCAVRIQAEGAEFTVKARYGGDCRLFTGLRDYYFLNGDNTGPQLQSLYSPLDNQPNVYFPGVTDSNGDLRRYGARLNDLPAGVTGANGVDIPFAGILNGATDNNGKLTIGAGGIPQLPPPATRPYLDPVITVTPFNPEQVNGTPFGKPVYWGRVDLTGDTTLIGMNSTGTDEPRPDDLDYVVLRMFLPAQVLHENPLTPIPVRGLTNQLPLWEFHAEHDKLIPFMDDSCIPMFQIGAPLRQMSSTDTNPKPLPDSVASRTLCFNSRPIRFGDFRTGRINFKALMIVPQTPNHGFPTDLLSDTKRPGGTCNPLTPTVTAPCWDVNWSELPPNIGDAANNAHSDCAQWVQVMTNVVNYDRYGRPYTVQVPTWEQQFTPNCPVLEHPDECTGRLAIRFAGYTMLKAAALGCVAKYHDMNATDGTIRDLNNVPVTPTLPGQGMIPYGTFGGASPSDYNNYNFGAYPAKEGYSCVPCRFHDRTNLFASTGAIPLDAEGRVPIFTFRMGNAPAECVKDTLVETRYFGSDQCTGSTTNLPPGHFCSSGNIPPTSCPATGGNVAGSQTVKICPGSGFGYDQVAFSWSPLILDTKGTQIRISRRFDDAVHFDIKGDGQKVLIDWPLNTDEAAFLVRPDPQGRIQSVKQLFGDNKARNGFEALRPYDTNKDGVVDAKDRKFRTLKLWFDRNRNGVADDGEVQTLASQGVERIYLKYNKPREGSDVKGKTLSGLYYNNKRKTHMNILDVYFHEYWKNGLPVGWKPPKRDVASKRK